MTYREKLELYQNGELSVEERAAVSADIEKQEAIGDYLLDSLELPELETVSEISEDAEASQDFEKQVNDYIRRAFLKTGAIVGAAVLVIVLLVIFALPKAVDAFYYDPGKVVASSESAGDTNRMTLDLAVYSELYLPGSYRDSVSVEDEGYGKYSAYIPQSFSMTGQTTDLTAAVTRNKLQLYNPNVLKRPTANAFTPDICGVNQHYQGPGAAGSFEEARAALKNLDADTLYQGYVTLDHIMDYEAFVTWCSGNGILPDWCALCVEAQRDYADYDYETASVNAMGFCLPNSCSALAYDETRYPQLSQFSLTSELSENVWAPSEAAMRQHVVSLLRYTADHPQFTALMDGDVEHGFYSYMADTIDSNGLHIYGFTVTAKQAELQRIGQLTGVGYIYTTLAI